MVKRAQVVEIDEDGQAVQMAELVEQKKIPRKRRRVVKSAV